MIIAAARASVLVSRLYLKIQRGSQMETRSNPLRRMRLYQRHRTPVTRRPSPGPKGFAELNHENMGDPAAIPNTQTPKRLRTAEEDEELTKCHRKSARDVASSLEKTALLDYVVANNNAAIG